MDRTAEVNPQYDFVLGDAVSVIVFDCVSAEVYRIPGFSVFEGAFGDSCLLEGLGGVAEFVFLVVCFDVLFCRRTLGLAGSEGWH